MPARRLSDDLNDLLAVPTQDEPTRGRSVEIDDTGHGWLQTSPQPADEPVDFDAHLRALGFDPAAYRCESVRTSAWEAQTKDGIQTLRSVRARVFPRQPGLGLDADALIAEIRRHKPRKTLPPSGDATFVFVVSDLQIGKSDGDGTSGSVTRFLTAVDDALIRIKTLRKAGTDLGHLLILGVGDIVEGFSMFAAQFYNNELDRREQVRVSRRLLIDAIGRLAREFEQVTVAAVAGNHGENRNVPAGGGKQKYGTTPADSDDVGVFEQAAEVLSANPDVFGHITWHLGGDPLMKQVEASGWIVGVTHGHIARESGTAEQKIRRWYERQAAAGVFHPAVLVTGHYHHLRVASWGDHGRRGCTWLQAPSTDGGSEWYAAATGEHSAPGVLTFTITPEQRVCDIAIL